MTATAQVLTNANLWEMDRRHSRHPRINFGPFEKDGALVISRGQGCTLWDADGRRALVHQHRSWPP